VLGSPAHAIDHFPLSRPVPICLTQWGDTYEPVSDSSLPLRVSVHRTSQISDHILRFSEVHFLQQIPHLQFHVFDHLADIGYVRRIVLYGHVLLDLAHHVSREV
jgi:hypothetical protein